MNDSFQYGDLIFLGIIAIFIALRLRSMLGKDQGIDPKDVWQNAMRNKSDEKIVPFPLNPKPIKEEKPDELPGNLAPSVAEGLKAIKAADMNFSTTEFILGARNAFEWVIGAFGKSDKEKLQMVLSPERFSHFMEEMDRRIAEGNQYQTTLIAIDAADITEATLKGSIAEITVQFTTEQINIIRDKENSIIHGNASEVEKLIDVWTFERDIKSRDPNWKITAT